LDEKKNSSSNTYSACKEGPTRLESSAPRIFRTGTHERLLTVRAGKEDLPGDGVAEGEMEEALVAMVAEVEAAVMEICFRVCERVRLGWSEARERSTHLFSPLHSREPECCGTGCSNCWK
jgi:hypothetical protein